MNQDTRNIKLRSVRNFRDIGGATVSGSGRVRNGVIFRSANPDRIGRKDIGKLQSLGIRTIIDLRGPGEISSGTRPIDHIRKLTLPLDFQQITFNRLKPVIRKRNAEKMIADISNDLYIEILDATGPVIKEVMEVLGSAGRYPVMIHCMAGKDRTGIIIALILLVCGVRKDLVIDDFLRSNRELLPYFKKRLILKKIVTFGFFPYRNMIYAVEVKRRNIESVIDRIENHYGGIEKFLEKAGVDNRLIDTVRNNLLS